MRLNIIRMDDRFRLERKEELGIGYEMKSGILGGNGADLRFMGTAGGIL